MLLLYINGFILVISVREAEIIWNKELSLTKSKLIDHILKLIEIGRRLKLFQIRRDNSISEWFDHKQLLNRRINITDAS